MESKKIRKTDRRTLYTIQIIKDALLELMKQQPFEKITVSSLCRQAEITRTTFYLHFLNLTDVLNEVLKDALQIKQSDQTEKLSSLSQKEQFNEALWPVWKRIAHSPKYHILLMDETLTRYLLNKIYQMEKNHVVSSLIKKYNLSKEEAEIIFQFTLYGSFTINKKLNWEQNDKWYKYQKTVMRFILEGLNHF